SVMTGQYLTGFQFVLNVGALRNVQLVSEVIDIKPEHYHITNGYLSVSWSDINASYVRAGAVLFNSKALTGEPGYVKDWIQLEHEFMSEEYHNEYLQTYPVYLHYIHGHDAHDDFVIMGNAPNPWSQTTNIRFYIPQEGEVEMVIRDITGKLIIKRTAHFEKGVQEFQISRSEIQRSGVLWYELKFNDHIQ